LQWAVTLRESGTLAGVVNLHGVDEAHCCAETSYALSPAYRGAGLMPEALGAVLRFGFAQAGFNRICAEVLAGNAASVRVLEKCGFRREGILRRRYRKDECFVDAWLYAVLSAEFSDQSK
ncbi:MAG: GNAT family N-acetyltransferase, partial [Ruthenibacterium lactatiformans]